MADEPRKIDLHIRGRTGLQRYGGVIYEELHPKLSGDRAMKVFQEMRDNDPIVGAILFLIGMLIRQSKWTVEPASQQLEDLRHAEFVRECKEDMATAWEDLISEICSMFTYGWVLFEIIYKRRVGEVMNNKTGQPDPYRTSRFSDGRIGWGGIDIRSQQTLDTWEFDEYGNVVGMWQYVYGDGGGRYWVPFDKSLLFTTTSFKRNPTGRSILRNAYRPWYFRKRIETFEAIGIERDLAGLPVMEAPPDIMHPNADSSAKTLRALLEKLVTQIKRDEYEGAVIPAEEWTPPGSDKPVKTGYKLRLLTTGGSRQMDTNTIIMRKAREIAMSVLAEFILLGSEKIGSFALASSKTNIFAMAIGAWLDSMAAVFNRYAIPRLFAANGIKLERLPKLIPGDVETMSLDELGKYIAELTKVGVIIPDEGLHRAARAVARLPEPEQDPALFDNVPGPKLRGTERVTETKLPGDKDNE